MQITANIVFDSFEEAASFFNQKGGFVGAPNHGLISPSQQTPASSVASSPASSAAPTPAVADALPLAHTASAAAQSPSPSTVAAPLSTAPTTSVVGLASPSDVPDFIKAARVAMATYMAKFPSGEGAAKAKAILTAHGLAKISGSTEAQCATLVTAFQTAA